jgi:hypothetical protein
LLREAVFRVGELLHRATFGRQKLPVTMYRGEAALRNVALKGLSTVQSCCDLRARYKAVSVLM